MMKKLGIIILVLIALQACNKNVIQKNTVYEDGDIRIELIAISDSRCPIDAVCFWEGDAAVELKITAGDDSENITLHTFGNSLQDTTVLGYKVELIDVSPYPKVDKKIDLKKYKITLEIN